MNHLELEKLNLPKHIAVIMDGNGRWASGFSKPRVWGHHKGAKAVRKTIESCREIGVQHLTLYAFSDENWNRPSYEVDTIMELLHRYLKSEQSNLHENNIRLKVIGQSDRLPAKVVEQLNSSVEFLKNNDGMELILALSYGAKNELMHAVKSICNDVAAGKLSSDHITCDAIEDRLWTKGTPPPDLLIRTSGEKRLSNFLLWQLAYTELYFTDVCWPDFDEKILMTAIEDYSSRNRRFGKVCESRPLSDLEVRELAGEDSSSVC